MLLACIVLSASFSQAQEEGLRKKVVAWYKAARFEVVDIDANGLLSKEEMTKFMDDFVFFFQKDNLSIADINKDTSLGKDEMENKWEGEDRLRTIFENQSIRKLNEEYQRLPVADVEYLKSNPELVVQLMKNYTWMTSHAFLTQSILQNKAFLKKHPEVYKAVSYNLLWLANNPYLAQKIYASPLANTLVPELEKWRKSHNDFISNTPQLKNSTYNLEVKE